MTAFDQGRLVEARSLVALQGFITERHGGFVLAGHGPSARYLQSNVGDMLFNDSTGKVWTVEIKAENRFTGNLFLETFSNYSRDKMFDRAPCPRITPGWMVTCQADLLFYHFLDNNHLYIFNFRALQDWAYSSPSCRVDPLTGLSGDTVGRIYDFPRREQQKYQQRNVTLGHIVPLRVLEEECVPPPRLVRLEAEALPAEAA